MVDDVFEIDTLGPVDVAIISLGTAPSDTPGAHDALAAAIVDEVAGGSIRVIDIAYVARTPEGEPVMAELADNAVAAAFASLDAPLDLLNEDDMLDMAEGLEPGTSAIVIVWENTWAGRIGAAVRSAGGKLTEQARIPRHVVVGAIDALRQRQALADARSSR
jgi:hypothetical protein